MEQPIRKSRPWGLIVFFIFVLLPVGVFALYTWGALKFAYSTGERAGYIQKISRKGWLCKTWEGELAMANLPGTVPQIFNFSVHDEAVARTLTQDVGQRIALTYEEHRGLPTSCFGETSYFITNVRVLNDTPAPAPIPPSMPVTPKQTT